MATEEYDKQMTIALLLVCVSRNDLATHNVDANVKELISGEIFLPKNVIIYYSYLSLINLKSYLRFSQSSYC